MTAENWLGTAQRAARIDFRAGSERFIKSAEHL